MKAKLEVLRPRNVMATLYWGWRSAAWWERLLFVPLAVREYWRYWRHEIVTQESQNES
jgi:hypothetical protein